jgi:hypothetical protein
MDSQERAEYNQQANMGDTVKTSARDICGMSAGNRNPSQAEEAEKNSRYHRAEADRADLAAAFFREHPEFDAFIQLIRAGVIHL